MAYIKSETKLCKGCAKVKPRISFPLYLTGPKAGQLSSAFCKPCQNKKDALARGTVDYEARGFYRLSDDSRLVQTVKYRKQKMDRIRAHVASVLIGATCLDCPEKDIVALQFDHRNPADKCFNISDAMKGSISLDRLKEEIAKCDIVCSNCHLKRTARMFGSWRLSVL